jgi:hypothetical protein
VLMRTWILQTFPVTNIICHLPVASPLPSFSLSLQLWATNYSQICFPSMQCRIKINSVTGRIYADGP